MWVGLLEGQVRRMLGGALSGGAFPSCGVSLVVGVGSCGSPPFGVNVLRLGSWESVHLAAVSGAVRHSLLMRV